ncbi:CCA tRNA nucleotidyltransferase [Candidatus Woesearchaeota archaeon]|nr:CCA tRNA nucleotidyltransferase [Candidatus Woesearchaeota archaeon]
MSKVLGLLESIKKEIKPSKRGELMLLKKVGEFIELLEIAIKKSGIRATVVPGGSFAKGTYLKNDYDVDIFVKFDYEYKEKNISEILHRILKPFGPEILHGSRDYFQIRKKISFEIVPVLDVEDPKTALNVTDMSPMHVSWANRFTEKDAALRDEIRLAKQFCKAQNVYGAESYISGFSGHVLDILVIYYKGFYNLLKASSEWKEKTVIDFYNYHGGNALKMLNKAKVHSPLILIDPILPERNAAAALSREKFFIFKGAAKSFIERPSKDFFEKKIITTSFLKKKYTNKNLIILLVQPGKGKTDVVGGRIVKYFEHVKSKLRQNDFVLLDSGWHWNKKDDALLWFVLPRKQLQKTRIFAGPPTKEKAHIANFKSKHSHTFIEKNKMYALVEREFRDGRELVIEMLKSNPAQFRFRNIKML